MYYNHTDMEIKKIIKEKGLTINQVADLMGRNRVTLFQTISGNPTVETLEKIANVIGCKVGDFFRDEKTSPDFIALVKDGADYYHANTLSELEGVVSTIKSKKQP